jgi:hypothetical protein
MAEAYSPYRAHLLRITSCNSDPVGLQSGAGALINNSITNENVWDAASVEEFASPSRDLTTIGHINRLQWAHRVMACNENPNSLAPWPDLEQASTRCPFRTSSRARARPSPREAPVNTMILWTPCIRPFLLLYERTARVELTEADEDLCHCFLRENWLTQRAKSSGGRVIYFARRTQSNRPQTSLRLGAHQ